MQKATFVRERSARNTKGYVLKSLTGLTSITVRAPNSKAKGRPVEVDDQVTLEEIENFRKLNLRQVTVVVNK
jgi:hypothetical protein